MGCAARLQAHSIRSAQFPLRLDADNFADGFGECKESPHLIKRGNIAHIDFVLAVLPKRLWRLVKALPQPPYIAISCALRQSLHHAG